MRYETCLSGRPATSSSTYNIEVTCNKFEAEGYKQDLQVCFASFSSAEEHLGSELPRERPVFLVVLPPVAPPTTLRSHVT